MAEHRYLPAAILLDDVVQLLPRTIEKLPITLTARQHVLKIASQQSSVLLRMLLRRILECQTFHHAYISFAKGAAAVHRQSGHVREGLRRFHRAREVARIDRR